LERKETIRVATSGAVEMRVELFGDPGDFEGGDPLPGTETGWKAEDSFETNDKDERKQRRIAEKRFGAEDELPDSYAGDDDELREVALRFPTTVERERGRDGMLYAFKRVYQARESARFNYYNELVRAKTDPDGKIGGDPESMSPEQLTKLVEGLRMLEGFQRGEYALLAADALADRWPARYGVMLRQSVLGAMAHADVAPVVELLSQPASPERDAQVNDYALRLVDEVREALDERLREFRVPTREAEQFFVAYDREEQRRKISEDIGDEKWEVRVELPGELIAHNGTLDDGAVVWTFEGKNINDRDHVIYAVSRLDHETPAPADQTPEPRP
jgi:hypothetical protein